MRLRFTQILFIALGVTALCSCHSGGNNPQQDKTLKGLYSFGPEVKSFKDCNSGHEYWVADSSKKLELEYSNMNFEKPYEPVYVEVEGIKVRSGKEGMGSEFDSTLIVKKLVKITKEIPQDMCN